MQLRAQEAIRDSKQKDLTLHCWSEIKGPPVRTTARLQGSPGDTSQQGNRDLGPPATRNCYQLNLEMAFPQSLQKGAQPAKHLDLSLERSEAADSVELCYTWTSDLKKL